MSAAPRAALQLIVNELTVHRVARLLQGSIICSLGHSRRMGRSFYDSEGQAVQRIRGTEHRGSTLNLLQQATACGALRALSNASRPGKQCARQELRATLRKRASLALGTQGQQPRGSGINSRRTIAHMGPFAVLSFRFSDHGEARAALLPLAISLAVRLCDAPVGRRSHSAAARFRGKPQANALERSGAKQRPGFGCEALPVCVCGRAVQAADVCSRRAAKCSARGSAELTLSSISGGDLGRCNARPRARRQGTYPYEFAERGGHKVGGKISTRSATCRSGLDGAKGFHSAAGVCHVERQKGHTVDVSNYIFVDNSDNSVRRLGSKYLESLGFDRNNYANKPGRELQPAEIFSRGSSAASTHRQAPSTRQAVPNVANGQKTLFSDESVTCASSTRHALTHAPESLCTIEAALRSVVLNSKFQREISRLGATNCEPPSSDVQAAAQHASSSRTGTKFAGRGSAKVCAEWESKRERNARLQRGQLVRASVQFGNSLRSSLVISRLDCSPTYAMDGRLQRRVSVIATNYSIEQTRKTSIGFSDWLLSAPTQTKYYATPFNGEGRGAFGNCKLVPERCGARLHCLDASIGFTHPDGKTSVRPDRELPELTSRR